MGGSPRPGGPTQVLSAPAGTRVAILLPLTGPRADIGQAMLKAAQMALDGPGAPMLDSKDTGGTPDGAAAAAKAAIGGGATLLLGPLTSAETAAVSPIARAAGVPVLAFTNDPAQQLPGVWTLGITPRQQVLRLVGLAHSQGKSSFAALLPENDLGRAMGDALLQTTASLNLPPPAIRKYGSGMASVTAATRDISGYASRGGVVDAQIKAARAEGDAEGRRKAADLSRSRPVPPPPFDTLLLADTGEPLSEIATLLPYYDVNRSSIRILGPFTWASSSSGSGQFSGAWFAAPDPSLRTSFDQTFSTKYGMPAPIIADLAYDAASIARVLAPTGGYATGALTQANGFSGVDGVLVLQPDGSVRRGLAVFQVQPGAPVIVDPSPASLTAPGA
jgi:branched-chain amino acid transport system substrate-binding protein